MTKVRNRKLTSAEVSAMLEEPETPVKAGNNPKNTVSHAGSIHKEEKRRRKTIIQNKDLTEYLNDSSSSCGSENSECYFSSDSSSEDEQPKRKKTFIRTNTSDQNTTSGVPSSSKSTETIVSDDEELSQINAIENNGSNQSNAKQHSHETEQIYKETSGNENDQVESPPVASDETFENQPNEKRKRARKGHANRDAGKAKHNKTSRQHGNEYEGLKKGQNSEWITVTKAPRKRSERCKKQSCVKRKNCCSEFIDEDCDLIFNRFLKECNWQEKKTYISAMVDKVPVKQRKNSVNSRRSCSFRYYLKKNDIKKPVCKEMFLATLAIGEWSVRNWLQSTAGTGLQENLNTAKKSRNQRGGKRRTDEGDQIFLRTFLNSLATVPSHYCRARTEKKYLEPIIPTKAELHRIYTERCKEESKIPLCYKILDEMFEDMNLALYQPKKDQCDTCVGYRNGTVTEEKWNEHQALKLKARNEKGRDKETEGISVYTQDLQALLMTPRSQASALYYRTKLAVHNMTFFDLKTQDVKNFVWNECAGVLTANEFTSIYVDFIKGEIASSNKKTFVFWSDGCTYQNRNCILSNGMLQVAVDKQVTILQKFLEVGHTQMECDSVHANIEKNLRKKEIYVPGEYLNIIKTARKVGKEYSVRYLDHSFFKDYQKLGFYTSIRPGKRVGDHVVTDIKCLKYNPNGAIQYKLKFEDEWQDLPRRPTAVDPSIVVNTLYTQSIKISAAKFKHLQELKEVVLPEFHYFYDNLPHA